MAAQKKTGTKAAVKTAPDSAHGGRGKQSSGGSGKRRFSWAVLFWLAFIIFIFGLFLFNREAIGDSLRIIQNVTFSRNAPVQDALPPEPVSSPTEKIVSIPSPEPVAPVAQPSAASPGPVTAVPSPQQTPAQPQASSPGARRPAQETVQNTQTGNTAPPAQNTAEVRERTLYFTQVDRSGSILRIKVARNLPLSDSPMTDTVQALIAGPNAEERGKGLISLIPPGTRIISATVRDNTAYINFNEDFQYNTYGVEGYAGQLRQIVFTATEFPNVKDVQILIDGRRIEYLGEGIWIGSPLSREMF